MFIRERSIPEGKKGVSYRIRYRADDRTLTDEEVNQYHERVTARLREIFRVRIEGIEDFLERRGQP